MRTCSSIFILFFLNFENSTTGRKLKRTPTGVHVYQYGRISSPSTRSSQCELRINFPSPGERATIESPGYPFNYPRGINCQYYFSSPVGTTMAMNCSDFNVQYSDRCYKDVFRFALDGDLTSPHQKYSCGYGSIYDTSVTNKLALSITSKPNEFRPYSIYPYRFRCEISVSEQHIPSPKCSCGERQKQPRIVNGTNAEKGAWPWRCSLYVERLGAFCGCSILNNNWILTAAHCSAAVEENEPLWVNVGDYDLSRTDDADNKFILIERTVVHPEYNAATQDNDITVLKMSEPITFSPNIQPICLPFKYSGTSLNGFKAIATGWGLDSYGGNPKNILQEVELTVMDTEECRSFGKYSSSLLTDNMYCTYAEFRDMCQGDSGGGVDIFDPESQKFFQIGIASWGIGCAYPDKPGALTKLVNPKYLNWIEAVAGNEDICVVE